MSIRAQLTGWVRVVAVVASAVMVAGLVVGTPSQASATVMPSLSVSASAGQVATVVSVRFGPANNGCGGVIFEPASGSSRGSVMLPFIGDHGTEYFVIPRSLGPYSPVTPGNYKFSLTCDTTNNPATAITVSVPFTVTSAPSRPFVGIAASAGGRGYWLAEVDGGVINHGHAPSYGSLPREGIVPASPIVAIAATPSASGYWLVSADGAVYAFGSAKLYGSIQGKPLNQPVVGIAVTSTGKGYWEVASDGAIFPFGDARAYGSMAGRHLNRPVVGMAVASNGKGYWEVASDGGIFTFGSARFHGSMGGHFLNQPIVGMSARRGDGYWEVAADGGVFAFAAAYAGSTGDRHLNAPITAMNPAPGGGYRLLATDGGVFGFGGVPFYGSGANPPVLPAGTAFIGVDGNTGVAFALDPEGRALHALFSVSVTHHRPRVAQFHLTPDRQALWFATDPTGPRLCSTIAQRNLASGGVHASYGGTWIALSPDGTRLAFTGCQLHDPTVTIVDLRTDHRWTARAPATSLPDTPVGFITWTPNGRTLLAEYLDAPSGGWKISTLTPKPISGVGVGVIPWGPTVINLADEARLTTTPNALYVAAGTIQNKFSIDTYNWTNYHRISHTPIALDPIEVVVRAGHTYFVGGPFTGGSSINTGFYRLETNGTTTELRHGIGEIAVIP